MNNCDWLHKKIEELPLIKYPFNLEDLPKNGIYFFYEKDETFRACFDRFITDFGHRGPAEFDIASVNWRENHEMVYTLIKTAQSTATSDLDRTQLIHDLLKQSKPCERFLLKLFLPTVITRHPRLWHQRNFNLNSLLL